MKVQYGSDFYRDIKIANAQFFLIECLFSKNVATFWKLTETKAKREKNFDVEKTSLFHFQLAFFDFLSQECDMILQINEASIFCLKKLYE